MRFAGGGAKRGVGASYPGSETGDPVIALKWVLDTNVVLDWLLFDDALLNPLRVAVGEGRLTIVTHPFAIGELRRVLGYPDLGLDATRQKAVLQSYEAQTSCVDLPQIEYANLPKGFPRCRDPDDDLFLALAYHSRADALVSRDKAVLALRRRAEKFGFNILNAGQLIATL